MTCRCTPGATCGACRNRAWYGRLTEERRTQIRAAKRARTPRSARRVTDDIDTLAVHLTVSGQRGIPLNLGERRLATALLTAAGHTAAHIADLLGVHIKTVERDRALMKETAA